MVSHSPTLSSNIGLPPSSGCSIEMLDVDDLAVGEDGGKILVASNTVGMEESPVPVQRAKTGKRSNGGESGFEPVWKQSARKRRRGSDDESNKDLQLSHSAEPSQRLKESLRSCQGHSCPITSTERLYTVQVSTTRRSTKTKDSNNYLDTNVWDRISNR